MPAQAQQMFAVMPPGPLQLSIPRSRWPIICPIHDLAASPTLPTRCKIWLRTLQAKEGRDLGVPGTPSTRDGKLLLGEVLGPAPRPTREDGWIDRIRVMLDLARKLDVRTWDFFLHA